MIDDRSSTVSLPEVPLLGVLPGTGGLTRLVDKRKVRRDLADVFCTTAEGVRADRAKQWRLVDHMAKPQQFAEAVKARALELAKQSDRPGGAGRCPDSAGRQPPHRRADRCGKPHRTLTVKGPEAVTAWSGAPTGIRCASRASSTARSSTCARTSSTSACGS